MEQIIFTSKDVKEFLAQTGRNWTGQIYDIENQDAKIPTAHDFGKVQQFIMKNIDSTETYNGF